jgi:hypothetical protein
MFVYLIVNSSNLKIYVGKTTQFDLNKYLNQKVRSAQRGRYRGRSHLFHAMQKYPSSVWSIHPLYSGQSDEDICEKEIAFIKALQTQDSTIGYNIRDGGKNATSMRTPEFRKAQSARMSVIMNTPEVKQNVSTAQCTRFSDPIKRQQFIRTHNTPITRIRHSKAVKERLSNPTKRQHWIEAAHSESANVKRGNSMKVWHSDPDTMEKRKTRAQRISEVKRSKGRANPDVSKVCPRCEKRFMVSFKERDRVCCSKGCASSYRFSSLRRND